MASELEFFLFDESYDNAHAQGLHAHQDIGPLSSRTITSCRRPRKKASCGRIRNGLAWRWNPGREFQGRMGSGPGRDQRQICRGAGNGRPACDPQERLQGDRLGLGKADHLHGQVGLRHGRQFLAYPPVACGRRTAKPLFHDAKGDHGMSQLMKHYHGRACSPMPARSPISSRPISTPTSASWPGPSRRRARSGASTTALPATGCAAPIARRCASSAGSAAPISIPISLSRRSRRRPRRHREEDGARTGLLGRCL